MSAQYSISGASARELVASVERGVIEGALTPGQRLPSVRALARDLGVSPATVSSAYGALRRRGLIVTRQRSGAVIADRPPSAWAAAAPPIPPGVRDLATGNPDFRLLPDLVEPLRRISGRRHLYGEPALSDALEAIARESFRRDGIDAPRIAAVSGGLDGIERVLATELRAGDRIAVEDPGWPGVLDLARALGLELIGVTVDEQGMLPEALSAALIDGARAMVATPRGQNPTGAAFSADRARALRAVLEGHPDVLVCEDDHLGPIAATPLRSLTQGRERWAVARSLAKSFGPDLRVAVLAADHRTLARVEGRQSLGPGWVSKLLQDLVADLWESATEVVARAAETYEERRTAVIAALASSIEVTASTGLNIWIPVENEDAAVAALLADGISVARGRPFRLGASPGVRVTIASVEVNESADLARRLITAAQPTGVTRSA